MRRARSAVRRRGYRAGPQRGDRFPQLLSGVVINGGAGREVVNDFGDPCGDGHGGALFCCGHQFGDGFEVAAFGFGDHSLRVREAAGNLAVVALLERRLEPPGVFACGWQVSLAGADPGEYYPVHELFPAADSEIDFECLFLGAPRLIQVAAGAGEIALTVWA